MYAKIAFFKIRSKFFLKLFRSVFEICLKFCYLKFLSRTSFCAYSTLFAFVLSRLLTD